MCVIFMGIVVAIPHDEGSIAEPVRGKGYFMETQHNFWPHKQPKGYRKQHYRPTKEMVIFFSGQSVISYTKRIVQLIFI